MKLGQCFHAFFLSVVYTNVGPWRVNKKWGKKRKERQGLLLLLSAKFGVSIKLIPLGIRLWWHWCRCLLFLFPVFYILWEEDTAETCMLCCCSPPLSPHLLGYQFPSGFLFLFIDWLIAFVVKMWLLRTGTKWLLKFLERRSILKAIPLSFIHYFLLNVLFHLIAYFASTSGNNGWLMTVCYSQGNNVNVKLHHSIIYLCDASFSLTIQHLIELILYSVHQTTL